MKRTVILISLILTLSSFITNIKFSKSFSKNKTPKTIALIHHNNLHFITVKVNGVDANFLVDTGAIVSIMDINQAKKYKFDYNVSQQSFVGIGGQTPSYNIFNYKINHDSINLYLHPVGADLKEIVNSFVDHNSIKIVGIIGSDFFKNNEAIIDYKNKQLIIHI